MLAGIRLAVDKRIDDITIACDFNFNMLNSLYMHVNLIHYVDNSPYVSYKWGLIFVLFKMARISKKKYQLQAR